ncbi:hypothetical protein ASPFODRAFT_457251 [Aspergillus luchuensis CBS 106.47]|uniref:Uncharacterized protein n=1 Tax=Aspergillus luchuensis (strain CBS 106.47) TaxID=1137211 RepID=A0A1M3T0X7_ASPLC|nr:hypothetical protein ASPFODRAFT_457251 [Aspergillus luchuensis CBS 106.47]
MAYLMAIRTCLDCFSDASGFRRLPLSFPVICGPCDIRNYEWRHRTRRCRKLNNGQLSVFHEFPLLRITISEMVNAHASISPFIILGCKAGELTSEKQYICYLIHF